MTCSNRMLLPVTDKSFQGKDILTLCIAVESGLNVANCAVCPPCLFNYNLDFCTFFYLDLYTCRVQSYFSHFGGFLTLDKYSIYLRKVRKKRKFKV